MEPWPSLPLFAPLAADQVWDLLADRESDLPKERIQRGTDMLSWYTQRYLQVQDALLPEVVQARQRVFELLDSVVPTGQLTKRWLTDIVYPPPVTSYADRLREWGEENFLLFDQHEEPEPQTTAAILLQRELDTRRRKLPLPRTKPRSFFCWRYDAPGLAPVLYELPLVIVGSTDDGPVYKPRPEPSLSSYILSTVWKGISWDDPAWIVLDEGAIRWVGEPTEEQLAVWLSEQEIVSLAPSASQTDRAVRALQIMADRLPHSFSSDAPM